jgi:hypothetical protein
VKVARSGQTTRLRLSLAESHILEQLFADLQDELDADTLAADDPVRQRLFPAAYEDTESAEAFREFTEAALRQDRLDRADQCLSELLSARSLVRTEIVLDAESADRWLRVLNDMRLSFGTRLNISEDDDYALDEHDPDVQIRARYVWLTALQDMLVTSLMG